MLDLPAEERIKYSAEPCPRCTFHHAWNDFRPPLLPRVVVIGTPCYPPINSAAERIAVGDVGMVTEVCQYQGPMYVRVRFEIRQAVPKNGSPIKIVFENFYPCDLEPL